MEQDSRDIKLSRNTTVRGIAVLPHNGNLSLFIAEDIVTGRPFIGLCVAKDEPNMTTTYLVTGTSYASIGDLLSNHLSILGIMIQSNYYKYKIVHTPEGYESTWDFRFENNIELLPTEHFYLNVTESYIEKHLKHLINKIPK